jgi:hypothetical protein
MFGSYVDTIKSDQNDRLIFHVYSDINLLNIN